MLGRRVRVWYRDGSVLDEQLVALREQRRDLRGERVPLPRADLRCAHGRLRANVAAREADEMASIRWDQG